MVSGIYCYYGPIKEVCMANCRNIMEARYLLMCGRKTKETRPMGEVTEYSYAANGLLKSVTDARQQVTAYSYDAGNRLVAVVYADGQQDVFVYNAVGNLINWNGADGISGVATYDLLNRKLSETVNYGGFSKA